MLGEYIRTTYPNQVARFGRLLLLLPALRRVSALAIEELFFKKTIGTVPIERLLSDMFKNEWIRHDTKWDFFRFTFTDQSLLIMNRLDVSRGYMFYEGSTTFKILANLWRSFQEMNLNLGSLDLCGGIEENVHCFRVSEEKIVNLKSMNERDPLISL